MFKVAVSPKFWATVEAILPGENGGTQTARFDVQFFRLSADEIEALREQIIAERMDDRAVARRVMCGFRNVADDDGVELVYSDETRDRLLGIGLAGPIVQIFFASSPRAKQKNL